MPAKTKKTAETEWVASKELSIGDRGLVAGDRLTAEDVAALPVGRLEVLKRVNFIRRDPQ